MKIITTIIIINPDGLQISRLISKWPRKPGNSKPWSTGPNLKMKISLKISKSKRIKWTREEHKNVMTAFYQTHKEGEKQKLQTYDYKHMKTWICKTMYFSMGQINDQGNVRRGNICRRIASTRENFLQENFLRRSVRWKNILEECPSHKCVRSEKFNSGRCT